jgi:OPA family glycerol-3-phosphate transporter-like MFS transporter
VETGGMPTHPKRLLRWQALTLGLLVVGYSGYYLCRSNLSVTLPLIIDDLAARGMDRTAVRIGLGTVTSLGTLAYALGKFLSGGVADFFGGRRNFLGGMLGAVVFTALFALGGSLPLFTLAWVGNRLLQSLGWVGMVKVSSRWFGFSSYGTVMGILSLSFLFGDAAARGWMGWLIDRGLRWQAIFYLDAAVMAGLFVLTLLLLKETPLQVGEPEPPANPQNLFGAAGEEPTPPGLRVLLTTLLRRPVFWFVCLLSLGLTLLRETFNTWTPTYFVEAVGLSKSEAATNSGLFPLFGGFSVLLAGYLSDRLGRGGRASIILTGLVLTAAALLVLGHADFGGARWAPVALVTLVAFVMIGPYSYLAGAVSLDFGGKQGSATACGIIDGVGYLGGVLAGDSMARISVAYGWSGAFTVLAGVAGLSCVAGALFLADQVRAPGPLPAAGAGRAAAV